VRRCDTLIDLHRGGAALDHLPLIGWYAGGDRADLPHNPWLRPGDRVAYIG
jgi:hypothetical protein